MVAAAVILRREPLPVRIDDSKRLTAAQRARAFNVILKFAAVGIGIACAEEIDERNILQASLWAMRRAIDDLPDAPTLVLVDGPFAPAVDIPCRPIIRGDQRSYVISCASIVAKVLRDRLMAFYHELYPHYGFTRHKGYGTALHGARLRRFGPCLLHRASFAPVRQLLQVPIKRTIDDTVALARPPSCVPDTAETQLLPA